MKIVIVGDGKVGNVLAQQLSQENHDVVIIDNNVEALKKTTDRFDVIGVVGNGATYSVQQEAGVDTADLLIAVTAFDERNILCGIVAKRLGAKHTIARVRNPEYADQMRLLEGELRFSMNINPEAAAATEIFQILRCPSATQISPFAHGKAELAEVKIAPGTPLIGTPLNQIWTKCQVSLVVCAVQRGQQLFIPSGDFVLEENDRLTIVSSPQELDKFFDQIKIKNYKMKNVMITGGSRTAYYLASKLNKLGAGVKIVESNLERCRELSDSLPKTKIIHGDARDWELIQEEGIEEMDAFVTLTNYDEENIVLSMYASMFEIPKIVTKVNDPDFPNLMDKTGLDIVISPLSLIADRIVGYVRALHHSEGSAMETMHKLVGGRLEALDFHVSGDNPFLGVPLRNLQLKPETLIASIVRDGKAIIPSGNTAIEKGDNVILIAQSGSIKKLQDMVR